jgi:hypothetical protein
VGCSDTRWPAFRDTDRAVARAIDVDEMCHIESGAAAWEAGPGKGPSRRRSGRESVRYHPYRRPPSPVVYADVATLMGEVDADGDTIML